MVRPDSMKLLTKLRDWFGRRSAPVHIRRGILGENAARKHLEQKGLKFLTANFRGRHGEIDLIFRAHDDAASGRLFTGNKSDCLVFVEVKTRSSEEWTRPADAVDARKRRLLSLTAEDYLRKLADRRVKWRFDVVEVLLADGLVSEVRHVVHAFVGDTRRPRRR